MGAYLGEELVDGELQKRVSDANQPYLGVHRHLHLPDVGDLELLLGAVEELLEEG